MSPIAIMGRDRNRNLLMSENLVMASASARTTVRTYSEGGVKKNFSRVGKEVPDIHLAFRFGQNLTISNQRISTSKNLD